MGPQRRARRWVAWHYALVLGAFSDRSVGIGGRFAAAAAAAVAVHNARLLEAEEAFGRLRQISQNENVTLSLVAQRVVEQAVRRAHAGQANG